MADTNGINSKLTLFFNCINARAKYIFYIIKGKIRYKKSAEISKNTIQKYENIKQSNFQGGNTKMQKLSVNLTIPIPSDSIIISKIEFQKLKQQQLTGVYWSMKELEQRVSRKSEWIKENILYPSKFRKLLDVELGGFVFYPKSKGHTWSFHALKMAEFLDKNFHRIFSE